LKENEITECGNSEDSICSEGFGVSYYEQEKSKHGKKKEIKKNKIYENILETEIEENKPIAQSVINTQPEILYLKNQYQKK
jgi:hypothetical protein